MEGEGRINYNQSRLLDWLYGDSINDKDIYPEILEDLR